jgi:hypothetical protein
LAETRLKLETYGRPFRQLNTHTVIALYPLHGSITEGKDNGSVQSGSGIFPLILESFFDDHQEAHATENDQANDQ